mmetsp:Transcript_26503/g.55437  ORF Transcript_26503/g.55437 Transcript_26503/m.55437 type:complete len:93 (+) Transcript_26503:1087-1365(+)
MRLVAKSIKAMLSGMERSIHDETLGNIQQCNLQKDDMPLYCQKVSLGHESLLPIRTTFSTTRIALEIFECAPAQRCNSGGCRGVVDVVEAFV